MNRTPRPFVVLFKALILFVLINVLYGLTKPPFENMSAYNAIFPGLKRMPFGDELYLYSLSIDNVDAMFAAHEISAEKRPDEFRVALVGDSSIWGEGVTVDETLAGQWNQAGLQCGERKLRFYNLGYPHPSIVKDLIFFDELKERQPDAIIWFVTLNTMMNQYRLHPFLRENRERALEILERYDIQHSARRLLAQQEDGFFQHTLWGQREFLARWLKLQALGFVWSATSNDTIAPPHIPKELPHDVTKDPTYRGLEPGSDLRSRLLLETLDAGFDLASQTPILLVNEPIFVARGYNSEIRYNDTYPRWAYDQYRELLAAQVSSRAYLDLWDAVPPEHFVDTAMHVNAQGEELLARQITPVLLAMLCK